MARQRIPTGIEGLDSSGVQIQDSFRIQVEESRLADIQDSLHLASCILHPFHVSRLYVVLLPDWFQFRES